VFEVQNVIYLSMFIVIIINNDESERFCMLF